MAAPILMCLAEIANDVFMMRMTFAHIVISLHKQRLPKSKSFMIWFLEVSFALLFFFISMGACHFVRTETQNDYLAEISLEERRAIERFFLISTQRSCSVHPIRRQTCFL